MSPEDQPPISTATTRPPAAAAAAAAAGRGRAVGLGSGADWRVGPGRKGVWKEGSLSSPGPCRAAGRKSAEGQGRRSRRPDGRRAPASI